MENIDYKEFQSTLPAWGATERLKISYHWVAESQFQSTLPAWGATDYILCPFGTHRFQSTLPAWGATRCAARGLQLLQFQSTLPAWGATTASRCGCDTDAISIHAPRVGSVNPRSPRGERRVRDCTVCDLCVISIHAPRVGSDGRCAARGLQLLQFQSTLPAWGATSPCSIA